MTVDPTTDPLLSVSSVAAMFDVGTAQVRDWIRNNKVSATKVNGHWRIPKSEVVRLANEVHGG